MIVRGAYRHLVNNWSMDNHHAAFYREAALRSIVANAVNLLGKHNLAVVGLAWRKMVVSDMLVLELYLVPFT